MPTLKQSAKANMTGWQPSPETALNGYVPPPPNMDNTPGRSPFMLASMPLNASTGDAFQRQFYGGQRVPTYRILPAFTRGGA